jgi:hypothetical protein
MTSITTWIKLEPRSRNADMNAGLQARIYDPLWLLARQWQVGEFQGEDNGSPASARWVGECARFTRYYPGPLPTVGSIQGQTFDGNSQPLEMLVEREPALPKTGALEKLCFAVDAGSHFFRILGQQALSKDYAQAFKNKYAFTQLSPNERSALDEASLAFFDVISPRAMDGRKLYASMKAALKPAPPAKPGLPSDLGIVPADAAEVRSAAESWLQWYETLIDEPGAPNATWSPERMEYGFSIAARMSDGEKVLTSREYFSGHLDWQDFNVQDGISIGANNDAPPAIMTRTVIPAPVTYSGMPAPRFWEFEDARVDFGAVNAAPEDLARMLLVEFAVSYGNDWFVIPIDLPVGSLCRTRSLVVTNTFDERFLIRAASELDGQFATWRIFQLSSLTPPGRSAIVTDPNSALFLLPPALPQTLESVPLEEVLFLRDEMANMAWAVERVIENAAEQPLNRFEQERYAPAPAPEQSEAAVYQLATGTPGNWIPLLPVQSETGLRLKRGVVLRIDGPPQFIAARGRLLNPENGGSDGLSIFEEEIPREGIRITRRYELARWHDGSTHLWIGRRKIVGRGEGSSGLKFDTVR